MMTQPTKYDRLTSKIFWFALPLMIAFFTWVTVMIYQNNTSVRVIEQQTTANAKLQDKMWSKIDENNSILLKKADADINEKEHQLILTKLNSVENTIDKIYGRKSNYGLNDEKPNDTVYFIPYKDMSIVSTEYKNN